MAEGVAPLVSHSFTRSALMEICFSFCSMGCKRSFEEDPDTRPLPPEKWAHAMRREEFFRPIKKPVTARIDADVLDWLKSKGTGHLTRINRILREAMERDLGKRLRRA